MRTGNGCGCVFRIAVGRLFFRVSTLGRVLEPVIDAERLACALECLGAATIGEDPEVPDAMHSVGQDMEQEAADELLCGDGGNAVAGSGLARPDGFAASEGDVCSVELEDAAVADRDPVGVAGQVAKDLFGIAERRFGVDDPVLAAGDLEVRTERSGVGEMGDGAVTFDLSPCMSVLELFEKAPPEQAGEDLDGSQECAPAGLPLSGCDLEAGVR